MLTPDRLSLNTATVREQWDLEQCVEGCLRHGLGGIAPWRHQIAEIGLDKAAKIIRKSGLEVSGLCRGGWFTEEGVLNKKVLDDNRLAVDEAVEIGAECLVMVVGGMPEGSRDLMGARQMVEEGLTITLEYARRFNMQIAIEPLHPMYAADRACVNTLRQALDLCNKLGTGIGVAVDVYHVWWDPDLLTQIKRAGNKYINAFHICDWLVPTNDMLTDRGMMGDGIIDISGIRQAIEAEGYSGLNEVEIFSANNWWKRDPDEVLKIVVERGTSCC